MVLGIALCGVAIAISARVPPAIRGFQEQASHEERERARLQRLNEALREIRDKLQRELDASSPDSKEIWWQKRSEQWEILWIDYENDLIRFHSKLKWQFLSSAFFLRGIPVDTEPPPYSGPWLFNHAPGKNYR
jgi:hypothetical protein